MKELFSVRTIILAGSLLLQLSTLCFQSCGAAGDVDLSFDPGSGVNGTVNAVVVQPDGKVIIGGTITTVKGRARFKLARLNTDGSDDSGFNPGTVISGSVYAVALQSDGKVLTGHDGGILRLNSDGTPNSSFDSVYAGTGPNGAALSIALQPDGKVLISGYFDTINGMSRSKIARLNANGSLDNSFNPGTGADGAVFSVALQSDGKVVIGGYFNTVNGTNRNGIARLNANGSLDNSFNPGAGADGNVDSVVVQSDGKVLIGGFFSTVDGTNRNDIARLNANGSLDSSFNPGTGATGDGYQGVSSLAVRPDGKVFIGGDFTVVNGTNRNRITRLNTDGSLDGSFNPGTGVNNSVAALAVQPNGMVLIAGEFTTVKELDRSRIARLNADGSGDSGFDPATSGIPIALQSDGKVVLGGAMARLNPNGSLESSFHPDLLFRVSSSPFDSAGATAVTLQPDGKVIVGGISYRYYGCDDQGCSSIVTSYFVARLNTAGSRDTNFTGTGAVGQVSSIAVQPDGRVVVGSDAFIAVKIVRLNSDGSLDSSFNPGTGPNGSVSSVASQPDGKVLVGGYFTAVNGTNRNGIARFNANGSLDDSFNPGTGAFGVSSVALQPDGKVLIGGSFTSPNGTNRNRIASLNADGSLDNSFNPGTGADGLVRSIALQSDGNVLIGGDFLTVNGVLRPHVARLYGDSIAPSLSIARSNASVIISWPVTGLNFQLQESTNLSLPNSWSLVAQSTVTNAGQISVTVPTTVGRKFFRLKSQ